MNGDPNYSLDDFQECEECGREILEDNLEDGVCKVCRNIVS